MQMHSISVTDHPCKDVRLPWRQFPAEVHPSNGRCCRTLRYDVTAYPIHIPETYNYLAIIH